MKGILTSYVSLYARPEGSADHIRKVEIPMIQRDYAQGRTDARTADVREGFLEVLARALAGGDDVGLDFVYGKVANGVFHPLDGQQRLTTLFLWHWYIASRAGELTPGAPWTRFAYETRPSARLFCESLVRHPLPADCPSPADWIRDQPWYLYTWLSDPTIQSMLVMVDAIHAAACRLDVDPVRAWDRLTATSSAISFYLLPIDDMESEEELYIKMNSRGRPLTEFENFKATFEQDIAHSDRADEFAHKIDGSWSDLMWPIHGGDNIVDDELLRYIDYVVEIAELRDGELRSGKIGPRARAIFGAGNPRSATHLDFLFRAFDVWGTSGDAQSILEGAFSNSVPGTAGYDPTKALLYGTSGINLFEECCHQFESQRGGNRTFTLQQSLFLYAVLLNLIHGTDDFQRRIRMLRNLLAASAEDEVRRENMPRLLQDVEALIVRGDLDAIAVLSSNQVQDERLKAEFLRTDPALAPVVYRLEDHPILRGTLSAFDLDAETLTRRADAFERSFSEAALWLDLTGALLATGDYHRRRPKSDLWLFGTASSENQAVWRTLLTSGTRNDLTSTRATLGAFLDRVPAPEIDLRWHLGEVMTSWLADREDRRIFDWRYHLVRYPAMRGGEDQRREGRTGIYWSPDGDLGYRLCMLRTKGLGGYHRDPLLLQAWLSSGVGEAVRNPWFIGWADPRWLRLERSLVGLRSVLTGFELEGSEDDGLNAIFLALCDARDDVVLEGGRRTLRIPQQDRDGTMVDTVDRVAVAAAFLRELVAAGL